MQIALPSSLRRAAVSSYPRLPILLAVIAVLALSGAGVLAYQQFFAPGQPIAVGQPMPVSRGTLASTVSATGSVTATKQAKLVFGASGRLKEINVAVGQEVKAGQVLARLASESQQLKLEQVLSQLTSARLKLQQLSEGATADEVAAAQASYDAAVAKYEQLQAGPTQADAQAAEASVTSARASYDQAVAKLQTLESGATAVDRTAAEASLESARNSLASAEAKLAQLHAGPTPEELASAQSAVDQARASLRSSEAKLEQATAGATTAELVAAQAAYDQAQANVASAKAKLDQVRATAAVPADVAAAQASLASAESSLVAARNTLAAKQDALVQAKAELEAQQAALNASVDQAKTTCETDGDATATCREAKAATDKIYPALRSAEAKVRQLSGDDAPEMQAAREALNASQAAYGSARAKFDQVKAAAAIPVDLIAAQTGYDNAVASLASARAKLEQVRAGTLPADMAAAQASVDSARASLISAEAKLRTVQQGAMHADVVATETAVETARANLAAAEAKLAAAGVSTPQDVNAAHSAVQSAAAGLESARLKLEQLRAGPTQSDLEAGRSSVASALSALSLKTGGPKASEIALQMEAVRQAELAVRQAQLELDYATLAAPFDGVVASITGNVGEQIAASGTTGFITLVDPREVRVDVTVDETDVARVQMGKSAQITFDALPGRRFNGRVLGVAPSGIITQGVVSYPVAISIDTGNQMLPAGLTASVNIIVDQKDGALMVPNRAVRRQGRETVVELLGPDGKPTPRPVQTGISNDQFTEIVQGLSEGEQVVIPATTTRSPNVAKPGFGGDRVFVQKGQFGR